MLSGGGYDHGAGLFPSGFAVYDGLLLAQGAVCFACLAGEALEPWAVTVILPVISGAIALCCGPPSWLLTGAFLVKEPQHDRGQRRGSIRIPSSVCSPCSAVSYLLLWTDHLVVRQAVGTRGLSRRRSRGGQPGWSGCRGEPGVLGRRDWIAVIDLSPRREHLARTTSSIRWAICRIARITGPAPGWSRRTGSRLRRRWRAGVWWWCGGSRGRRR